MRTPRSFADVSAVSTSLPGDALAQWRASRYAAISPKFSPRAISAIKAHIDDVEFRNGVPPSPSFIKIVKSMSQQLGKKYAIMLPEDFHAARLVMPGMKWTKHFEVKLLQNRLDPETCDRPGGLNKRLSALDAEDRLAAVVKRKESEPYSEPLVSAPENTAKPLSSASINPGIHEEIGGSATSRYRRTEGKRKFTIDIATSSSASKKAKLNGCLFPNLKPIRKLEEDESAGLRTPVTPETARNVHIASPGSPCERRPATTTGYKPMVSPSGADSSITVASRSRAVYHERAASSPGTPGLTCGAKDALYNMNHEDSSFINRLMALEKALRDIATPKDVLDHMEGRIGAVLGEVAELDEVVSGLKSCRTNHRKDIDDHTTRFKLLEDALEEQRTTSDQREVEMQKKVDESERKMEEYGERLRAMERQLARRDKTCQELLDKWYE